MINIGKNLKKLREKEGLSQEAFAKALGVSRNNIMSYERGSAPGIDFLTKVVNHFHISYEKLIEGIDKPASREVKEPISIYNKRKARLTENQDIPLFNIEATAGLLSVFEGKENVIDTIHIPNIPKCDGAIYVTGDSMYPILKSGDIVAYKQVNDIKNGIFWGEMYILAIDIDGENMTTVKYIQKSEIGDEYIKLVSHNQHHQPKDILLSSIRALAVVKVSIRMHSMS